MAQNDDDSTRARVLDLIAEKGPVSAAQLAKVLSLTPAAVRRHITALEEAEQIAVHSPALTGTPGGIGKKRTPPLFMQPGDRVEVEIEQIGCLINSVRSDAAVAR